MENIADHDWEGATGKTYTYRVHPIGTPFDGAAFPGNYIFAIRLADAEWQPVIIGTTEAFSPTEMRAATVAAIARGATYVHAHPTALAADREAEAEDLRRRWLPG